MGRDNGVIAHNVTDVQGEVDGGGRGSGRVSTAEGIVNNNFCKSVVVMVGSGDEVEKTVVWGFERESDLLALEDGIVRVWM